MEQRARATAKGVEAFVERARALDDEDRLALAQARAAIDERFHTGAWKAANEIVAERARDYFEAWVGIGAAFVPECLEELVRQGAVADPAEASRWQEIARSARTAMEDALLALVAADRLRPPDLRELYGPWKAMLEAAHERSGGSRAS